MHPRVSLARQPSVLCKTEAKEGPVFKRQGERRPWNDTKVEFWSLHTHMHVYLQTHMHLHTHGHGQPANTQKGMQAGKAK